MIHLNHMLSVYQSIFILIAIFKKRRKFFHIYGTSEPASLGLEASGVLVRVAYAALFVQFQPLETSIDELP